MPITVKAVDKEPEERFNVAEAKRRFSDLLGRVAYGGVTILITRRGRPMAKLVPVGPEEPGHLADVQGWLDNEDPFFAEIDVVVEGRLDHTPRMLGTPRELGFEAAARPPQSDFAKIRLGQLAFPDLYSR